MAPLPQRSSGRRAPNPASKLAFVEALLACEALVEACRIAVEWVVRSGRLSQVTIAIVDFERSGGARLVGAAAHGFDDAEVAALSVDLDDRDHPLVQALSSPEPLRLTADDLDHGSLCFDGGACTALALPTPLDRDPVALALFDGDGHDEELGWAFRVLGRRLVALSSLQVLAARERRLDRERALLQTIIDSVVDPIVVTDANGATILANAPAERLLTAAPDAPVEEVLRVRANDAHFSSHVANLFFLDDGGRLRGELGLVDPKTAMPVPVEAISGKIVSERGEVTAVVTILHDLTEQMEKNALYEELKRASSLLEAKVRDATAELVRQNELLQRQALELEAASSAKSQFLANMSHEVRTPLNAILGYTSMMLQGVSGPLPPSLVRPLTRIDSNGRHLLTIINDILDISRIEAGRMPLHLTQLSPSDVVREVLSELEPLIARAGLEVRVRFGKNVPVIWSDRAKVKQIVMNLVSNALKFTPKGSVTVSVTFSQRRSQTSISVVDTGIGIAGPDQETVFQAFRQVDSSPTRAYGGTGLGLAICRRLANLLGGDVRLTSALGKGSTFKLVLPANGAPKGAVR